MIQDRALNNLKAVLKDYLDSNGYIIITGPYSSSMTLDNSGGFIHLLESIIIATAMKKEEGISISCELIPSKNSIYIEGKFIKRLD